MGRQRRRMRENIYFALALLALAFMLAACGPEGNRVEGDGKESGADVGNWADEVQMHGDDEKETRVYYQTPNELATED